MNMPYIHKVLATLFTRIRDNGIAPDVWGESKVKLIHKNGSTDLPSNFRMIALTSNIAKLYHTIEAQRTLDFMTGNNYLDQIAQKAYLDGVNGCVEHITVIQEIIDHAVSSKKTAHIAWFDLEDAFGSLNHKLIPYIFKYYNIPQTIITYITSLYTKLQVTVETKEWKSETFKFKRGAFQGDPFSGAIFLVTFNPIIQFIKKQQASQGYEIKLKNNSVKSVITTPFADDFNIISRNKDLHQNLVQNVERKIRTMGLILKPSKCRAMSIQKGTPKIGDFHLTSDTGMKVPISSVLLKPLKFLGSIIAEDNSPRAKYDIIEQKLRTKLENINKCSLRGERKSAIYSRYALPSMRFFISVHQIHKTHQEKLDTLTRKYLKSWLSIPARGATDAAIFHPNMLGAKTPSILYREATVNNYTLMRLKGDSMVNHTLDSRLERESGWKKKSSTIVEANTIYTKNIELNKFSAPDGQASNTEKEANLKKAKKANKDILKEESIKLWNEKVQKLVMQGDFVNLVAEEKDNVTWKSFVHNLPKGLLPFALKASTNTLNTPDNLRRWGIKKLANCSLCGNHCTLLHILNYCKISLDQGRYDWRHDSIVKLLATRILEGKPASLDIYADIQGYKTNGGTIPANILCTLERPDIVFVEKTSKQIVLLELTCSFESNIETANSRKKLKYQDLKTDLEAQHYTVTLIPFEVGSRGQVTKRNRTALENIFRTNRIKLKTGQLFKDMSKIALLCSFSIFHAREQPTWQSPPYLSP